MPKVWESYVAKRIAERWGEGYRVAAPYPFDLSNDGGLRSEADVTVWDEDDHLVALYDAKYKRLEYAPSTGDIYQMVTYCTRLGINEATLVYPGSGQRRTYSIGDVRVNLEGLPMVGRTAEEEAAA
jgi:5-methylcytosine-specific restriction endonuclease McrBC regulatory subunit McrC